MAKLIFVSGVSRSGKDFLGGIIAETLSRLGKDVCTIAFADSLKATAAGIFGLPFHNAFYTSAKDAPVPTEWRGSFDKLSFIADKVYTDNGTLHVNHPCALEYVMESCPNAYTLFDQMYAAFDPTSPTVDACRASRMFLPMSLPESWRDKLASPDVTPRDLLFMLGSCGKVMEPLCNAKAVLHFVNRGRVMEDEWIIVTDARYEHEMFIHEAYKHGFDSRFTSTSVRVNRTCKDTRNGVTKAHPSETHLDRYAFDSVVTLPELCADGQSSAALGAAVEKMATIVADIVSSHYTMLGKWLMHRKVKAMAREVVSGMVNVYTNYGVFQDYSYIHSERWIIKNSISHPMIIVRNAMQDAA